MDLNKVFKEFSCDDCSLVFYDNKQFLLHRKYHTSLFRSKVTEKNLLEENCPLCFVKFADKYKDSLEELLDSARSLEKLNGGSKRKQVFRCKYYPKCNAVLYGFHGFAKHVKEVHNDHRPYVCLRCNYTTPHFRSLKTHLFAHAGYKTFKCNLCTKEYRRNGALNTHLLSSHRECNMKSHDCSYCDRKFFTPSELRRHLRVHPRSFKCPICPVLFSSKQKLKNHLERHYKRKDAFAISQDCPYCGKNYVDFDDMSRHLKIHFPGLEFYKCRLCPRELSSKTALIAHEKTHHRTITNKCILCAKEYRTKVGLKSHLLSCHKDGTIKSHDCSYCDKKFSASAGLKMHLKKHLHTTEILKCHLCPRKYSSRKNLENHLKIHYNTFKCESCPRAFTTKESLNRHTLNHAEGDAEPELFKCHICSKQLSTKCNLKAHLKTHRRPNSFTCDICCRRFISEKFLKRHKMTHLKEGA